MINKIRSKKSQIGETITWFVAFLLIFFIMLLFVSICFVYRGQKEVSTIDNLWKFNYETKSIDFSNYPKDPAYTKLLSNFLDSEIEPGVRVKEYLVSFERESNTRDDGYLKYVETFLNNNFVKQDNVKSFIILYSFDSGMKKYVRNPIYTYSQCTFCNLDNPQATNPRNVMQSVMPISSNKYIVFGLSLYNV